HSGLDVQLCGDAHLSNFGIFLSPERRLVFDVNDFDETHPGPFEWDVKRLAASIVVASQANGFTEKEVRRAARKSASSYRKTIVKSASTSPTDCWYDSVNADDVLSDLAGRLDTAATKETQRQLDKARHRDSSQALAKLCRTDLTGVHIKSDPPLLVPAAEIITDKSQQELREIFTEQFANYRKTLPPHIAVLFDQFQFIEAARKVVGVGSVGTRCWIALFSDKGGTHPLFLQLKEAQQSVLAPYVKSNVPEHRGHRVVFGQQLMQASSDIFLGWFTAPNFQGDETHFYVRQLRDGKGSAVIEAMPSASMDYYAELCGRVLAQAHARTDARTEIADLVGDLGKDFDNAIADFSVAYSALNLDDHARLVEAISAGEMSAAPLEAS
ncbi:MAG: DUF2252 domain-containing protein, partial [Gordonia sp. (in: high G+C Gram-positive bacteria)]